MATDRDRVPRPASTTDRPILTSSDDTLNLKRYALALAEFVVNSETPITIGVQGECGSGKSSLMNLFRQEIETRRCASAWVNTWEHAIFRTPREIVPAILRGLLESLREQCQAYWPSSATDQLRKVVGAFKKLGRVALAFAAYQGAGMSSAHPATDAADQSLLAGVAGLKREFEGIIDKLVQPDTPYDRVVFFLDDVDRLEPGVAVEVLEALKNVFEVEHCVFVLAVDYEVVVRGLESRFGPRTAENEREFRSFFDKIVQVPFSVPVSHHRIGALLREQLARGRHAPDPAFAGHFERIAQLTVGAVPRNVKKLVNLFSLLSEIRPGENQVRGAAPEEGAGPRAEFCLFALLALEMAYPRIYRLLLAQPDFQAWDDGFARRHRIRLLDFPSAESADELVDEKWEQVVFSFCEADPHLRARRSHVLLALNELRHALGEPLGPIVGEAAEIASLSAVERTDGRAPREVRGRELPPSE